MTSLPRDRERWVTKQWVGVRFGGALWLVPPSWEQLKGAGEARTDADGAEIAAIRRQNTVYAPSLSNGDDRPIDQSDVQCPESGVELEGSDKVRWEGQLVLVPCPGIEDLGDESSHGRPILSKEVVDLGQNEPGHDDEARGGQNVLVLGKARLAAGGARERAKKPAGIRDDRRDQPSRSRNSSASFPSLLSVDSNRRVDGGRRPV